MNSYPQLTDRRATSAVITILVAVHAASALAGESWQETMLFHPPATQLEAERRGRIMIYDGLKDTQINQAMDTEFDRIQSMMFVRTVSTDTSGESSRDEQTGPVVVEDDGC
jgi:hypothetical protein